MSSIEIVKRNCIKYVKLCYIIKISAQDIREKEGFSFDAIHLTYLCFVFRNSGLHEVKFSGEVSRKSSFRVLDPVFLTRPDITNMGFQNYFKLPIGRKKTCISWNVWAVTLLTRTLHFSVLCGFYSCYYGLRSPRHFLRQWSNSMLIASWYCKQVLRVRIKGVDRNWLNVLRHLDYSCKPAWEREEDQ